MPFPVGTIQILLLGPEAVLPTSSAAEQEVCIHSPTSSLRSEDPFAFRGLCSPILNGSSAVHYSRH